LIVSFDSTLRGKGGKRAMESIEEVDKTSRAWEEEVNQNVATNVSKSILDI
jgi:hypothetical protein